MERIILRKKGRELAYKLVFGPLYHIKYLWMYGKWDFTDIITLGTSTYCNLRCNNCPNSTHDYGLKKNEKLMEEELFHKIIDELKEVNYKGNLWFHFFNEPLGDNRLTQLVRYAKNQIPKAKRRISSNGILLTLEKYRELIENGVDSFTITQYSEEIPKNLPPILEYDKNNGNYITFRKFTDDLRESWGGEIEGNILEKARCSYPDNLIVISPKGEVVLCCNDYHSSTVWGNLKNEKLIDIFNKKKFRQFRKDVRKKKFVLPICKRCRGIN
jgi:radical SAM protein with 4Fe4S-binding SPASM domain